MMEHPSPVGARLRAIKALIAGKPAPTTSALEAQP